MFLLLLPLPFPAPSGPLGENVVAGVRLPWLFPSGPHRRLAFLAQPLRHEASRARSADLIPLGCPPSPTDWTAFRSPLIAEAVAQPAGATIHFPDAAWSQNGAASTEPPPRRPQSRR